jgi:hypothetical protein
MAPRKLRHYVRLDPDKAGTALLSRAELLRVDELGERLGFAVSVLNQRGLLTSSTSGPDAHELRPPLLTWPFLDYVASLDLRGEELLELGAGHSTLWFATRFSRVRSFETDPDWHAALEPRVGARVELTLTERAALEEADFPYQRESWLVVDFAGKRSRFLARFFARLGAGPRPKAIVLDNADWYRRGAAVLRERGYLEIPFYGFKAGQTWISCTSLFLDPQHYSARPGEPFFQPPFSRTMDNAWDDLE